MTNCRLAFPAYIRLSARCARAPTGNKRVQEMSDDFDTSAAWRVPDLMADRHWVFPIDEAARAQMAHSVKQAFDPARPLFDYSKDDFDLGPGFAVVDAAAHKAYFGGGFSLVKGLPRDLLSPAEYKILAWAIGLHLGVPRPQGVASQYVSEVRAAGMNYRSAAGRGYNSNAELDFHTDGCDLVGLACYNKAKSGGQSRISSSVTAWQILSDERPDLAEVARQAFHFGRNQEEAPDEGPYYTQPLFDFADGRLFGKWNRNRMRTAQELKGVPRLSEAQKECTDVLDEILRRPEVMFTMWLEPGDLQFLNNHTMLHSRTRFEDGDDPDRQRLLYRIWIAPPNSVRLPDSWADFFRTTEPGTVRGGIRGHQHDETCKEFERRQAKSMGMPPPT
jgi:hypothetical protein